QAGFRREERVLLCALDTIDFPTVFLGCLLAGVVPVAVNTLLTVDDYAYMLEHSGARAVVVSAPLMPTMQAAIDKSGLTPAVTVAAANAANGADAGPTVASVVAGAEPSAIVAATGADDMAFWLYSSGSTGRPKGTVHTHGNLFHTADLYARRVLGI